MKQLIEFGPLVIFLLTSWKAGPFWATGLFMAATLVALAVSYWRDGHVSKVLLFSAVLVAFFGGLTLYLHDQSYIQIKVTVVNAALGIFLLVGLLFKRSFLSLIIGSEIKLPEAAWRVLTLRWGLFFIFLALLNEVLRHSLTWAQWSLFKGFGLIGLTVLFTLANLPFMAKHMAEDEGEKNSSVDV